MPIELLATVKEENGEVEKMRKDSIEKSKQTNEKISESNIQELGKNFVEDIKNAGDGVMSKLDEIKKLTPEQLGERMEQSLEQTQNSLEVSGKEINDYRDVAKDGLTDEEKTKIKEKTGCSDEIINAIGSWKEYEIYENAGLVEAEIGGKECFIREDIDWNQKDAMGRTNKERAEQGLSPINRDGKVIELHHIGQHAASPLAELTQEEHRGKGNDIILHDKTKESEIDRQVFASERSEHWAERAQKSEEKEWIQ